MKSLRRSTQFYLPGLFVIGALVAFSINLNNYFLSDDFAQIGKVLGGDFSVTWGHEYGGFFRPLFIWSYVIDGRLWGAHPFGYHLTNAVLHGANSFLVFRLGRALFSDGEAGIGNRLSLAAAVLFLFHPSHTEAVSWISGRADLIATSFVLVSLWSYLAYEKHRRTLLLIVSLLSFWLALLAKESAICLPFIMLVLSFRNATPGKTRTVLLKSFASFAGVLVAFIALRAYFIGAVVGGYGASQHLNFSPRWIRDRLLEASTRSVLPTLPASWSLFLFKPLQSPLFYLIVLVSLGLITIAIVVRRKWYGPSKRKTQNRLLLTLLVSFLVSLLPVISLRLNLYETLGERFLYLPTVFSVLLLAHLSVIWIRDRRVWLLILICVAGFYSINLYRTTRVWREASQLVFALKNDLAASASNDRVLILNAPDNLRGVPLFHNGLPEALQFFQKEKSIKQVDIVSFQSLHAANDPIELNSAGDQLTLRASEAVDRFDRIKGTDCLDATSVQSNSLRLQWKPCSAPTDVFFFSSGKMNRFTRN